MQIYGHVELDENSANEDLGVACVLNDLKLFLSVAEWWLSGVICLVAIRRCQLIGTVKMEIIRYVNCLRYVFQKI